MTRSARLCLEDIKESIAKVQRYTQGQIYADFVNDDHQIIWKTIQDDLPILLRQINRI